MADEDDQDLEEEEEDFEQVLFQGPMFDAEANLKDNPRLVRAALVPAKRMVSDALARRAHDVQLEPTKGRIGIRFVIDGVPNPAGAIPGKQGMAMIQMLKLLAGLNTQEREKPQTGGIFVEFEETKYELFLTTEILKAGVERLKIRVQNPKISYLHPQEAGMPEAFSDKLRELTLESQGIIIACGPRGSGVTSLSIATLHSIDPYLYSIFNMADVGGRELVNVADYEQEEGHDLEMSFDRVKRREADIIYMPPMVDPEVVQTMFDYADQLCFIAEMPGLSITEAIQQLVEWVGLDKVARHLKAVVSQKLIRTLCDDCKQAFRPNPQLLRRLNLPPETTVLYRAPSPPPEDDPEALTIEELCEDCDGIPYHGRMPVYELMENTAEMQQVISSNFSPEAIREQMKAEGQLTLQRDALRLVQDGKTSLEEVQKAFAPPGGRRRRRRPSRRPPA